MILEKKGLEQEEGMRTRKVFPALENVSECLCSQNEKDKEVCMLMSSGKGKRENKN